MTITRVAEQHDLLHGEGPGGPLWGIVDCARDPSLYPDVVAMGDDAACLFAGNVEPVVRAASPHLVRLREGSAMLHRWRTEGLGQFWGTFYRSNLDGVALRKHFRKRLLVLLPDRRRVVYRFWDPRVAAFVSENSD